MKNKTKMGRPSKLTPERQDEIVELLKAGNYVETACALVGVGRSTFYDWMEKAEMNLPELTSIPDFMMQFRRL